MATFSIIQKSDLEGASRLDAEYYQPQYLRIVEQIKHLNNTSIKESSVVLDCSAFYPSITDHYNTNREGTPFLRVNEIQQGFVKITEDTVFLPTNILQEYRSNIACAEPGDIVIAKGGNTLGKVGLLTDEYSSYSVSRDLIILKTGNLKYLNKYYLWLFLHSNVGQSMIIRTASQTGQPHLTLPSIDQLRIPIIKSQKKFEEVFNDSMLLLNNSIAKLYEAEQYLFKELGLKNFSADEELSYIVDLSEVDQAKRVDAEYFQPKYKKLIEKLSQRNTKILTEVIETVVPEFNPQDFSDKEFNYVELSNINASIGIIDGYSVVLGREAPSRARRILREGDVIISSIEGSLEKVAYVSSGQEDYLASTGFFQFRSKIILPEVLLILAKSIVLQMQMQKHCAGTILSAVPADALNQMIIPILPNEIQDKVAKLVRQSHEARTKSGELLEQAKREVEEMIEKGNE